MKKKSLYLSTCFLFLLIMIPLATLRGQAWQDIPLTGSGGAPLYNYATMLAATINFYDANFCGINITGQNRFNWRGDCHVNDGGTVTLSSGGSVYIDARGGYHDAGDHIKFGITNAYAASTLGWGYYEFKSEYEETGQAEWLLRAVKWATDYFIRCHPEPNTFLYSVGSDKDHSFWGPPELQSDEKCPRDLIVCTPSNPASDVCGSTAAALALMYINYRDIDMAYSAECLDHAIDLFNLGRNNLGLSDGLSFYPPSIYWDDLAWGAIWLYIATGDEYYLDDFNTIISPGCAGLDNDTNRENGISWENQWTQCWDAVWAGAFIAAAGATGHPAFIEQVKFNLETMMYDIAESPAGLVYLHEWGSLRYATAMGLTGLAFYNNFPAAENEIYRDFGASQMSYALGSNPLNRCYIVGCGNNSPRHPHHDAAHGSDTGFLDDPPEHKHLLYGALVGGPGEDDQHNDATEDFIQNEVSIDFNAACVGAMAGMRRFFGPDTMPDPEPTPEPPIEAFYVESKIEKEADDRLQVTAYIHNHSVHPPHFESSLSYRYFADLSDVFDQGYDFSNLKIETVTNEKGDGTVTTSFQPWDELNRIYYLEVDYNGVQLYNKREFQFGIIFTTPNFLGKLDSSNDFSLQGMGSTLAKNSNMPVYRDGVRIWGNEPYKDQEPPARPQGLSATAIGSSQVNLDWQDNSESDLDHYNIYQSRTSGFTPGASTLIGTSTVSSFSATDLQAQTVYYFRVTAVDDSFNEGTPSSQVSATTLTPDPDPPGAPRGLLISSVDSFSITLDWYDNSEADLSKYRVYRSPSPGFSVGSTTYAGDTLVSNFIDTGLNSQTTYYYKVCSVDTSSNQSTPSEEVSGTTLPPPPLKLRARYKCTNTGSSTGEIRFDAYLFNDDIESVTLTDVTLRYWFTSEPQLGNLTGISDYADSGQTNITYSFGSEGSYQYMDIGFKSTVNVPTWVGGTGASNLLPPGANTGQIQNRFFDQANHVTFNQANDWSFDPGKLNPADWDHMTVHYQGDVICWGYGPGGTEPTPDPTATPLPTATPVPTTTPTPTPTSPPTGGSPGDVNNDGNIDIVDALLVAQEYVGLNPATFNPDNADVNCDGGVDIVDALLIAQYYVGLISEFC
ncbi:MAG: glycoside hydrolase family 9 protein [Spirochaetales bacterium]|nr:glycoside hydrolase family 9 protein [Spirochaetales bacterium]